MATLRDAAQQTAIQKYRQESELLKKQAEESKQEEERGVLDTAGDAASFVGSGLASGFGEGLGNLTRACW